MSVNKEYQIVNLMRVTLSIIFCLVVLFLIMKFLWDSEVDPVTKFSSFFTAISSLGILATIVVYFWQKNDAKEKSDGDKNSELMACSKIYKTERMKYKKMFKTFILIREKLKKTESIKVKIRRRGNIFTFILKYNKNKEITKKHTLVFFQSDMFLLNEISLKLINIDIPMHEKCQKIIFAYHKLHVKIDSLFIMYNIEDNNLFEIDNVPRFIRKNNFKVDSIYNETFN